MTEYINIKKDGSHKCIKDKNFEEKILFKKCGFKKDNDFGILFTKDVNYKGDNYILEVWGRNKGDNSSKNTFDFSMLNGKCEVYGSCLVICKLNAVVKNMSYDMWNEVLEILKKNLDNDTNKTHREMFSDDSEYNEDSEDEHENEDEEDEDSKSSNESIAIYDSELQSEEYNYEK